MKTNQIPVYLRRCSEIIAKLRMKWKKKVSRPKLATRSFQWLELICVFSLRTLYLHDVISWTSCSCSKERLQAEIKSKHYSTSRHFLIEYWQHAITLSSTDWLLVRGCLMKDSLSWFQVNVLPHSKCFARSNLSIHSVYTAQKKKGFCLKSWKQFHF